MLIATVALIASGLFTVPVAYAAAKDVACKADFSSNLEVGPSSKDEGKGDESSGTEDSKEKGDKESTGGSDATVSEESGDGDGGKAKKDDVSGTADESPGKDGDKPKEDNGKSNDDEQTVTASAEDTDVKQTVISKDEPVSDEPSDKPVIITKDKDSQPAPSTGSTKDTPKSTTSSDGDEKTVVVPKETDKPVVKDVTPKTRDDGDDKITTTSGGKDGKDVDTDTPKTVTQQPAITNVYNNTTQQSSVVNNNTTNNVNNVNNTNVTNVDSSANGSTDDCPPKKGTSTEVKTGAATTIGGKDVKAETSTEVEVKETPKTPVVVKKDDDKPRYEKPRPTPTSSTTVPPKPKTETKVIVKHEQPKAEAPKTETETKVVVTPPVEKKVIDLTQGDKLDTTTINQQVKYTKTVTPVVITRANRTIEQPDLTIEKACRAADSSWKMKWHWQKKQDIDLRVWQADVGHADLVGVNAPRTSFPVGTQGKRIHMKGGSLGEEDFYFKHISTYGNIIVVRVTDDRGNFLLREAKMKNDCIEKPAVDVKNACKTSAGKGVVMSFSNKSPNSEHFTVMLDGKVVYGSPFELKAGTHGARKFLPISGDSGLLTIKNAKDFKFEQQLKFDCKDATPVVVPTQPTSPFTVIPAPIVKLQPETTQVTVQQSSAMQAPNVPQVESKNLAKTGTDVMTYAVMALGLMALGLIALFLRKRAHRH